MPGVRKVQVSVACLGGGLLVAGSILPWASFGAAGTSGVQYGVGIISLLAGLMSAALGLLAGVAKSPQRRPRKTAWSVVGSAALSLVLAVFVGFATSQSATRYEADAEAGAGVPAAVLDAFKPKIAIGLYVTAAGSLVALAGATWIALSRKHDSPAGGSPDPQ